MPKWRGKIWDSSIVDLFVLTFNFTHDELYVILQFFDSLYTFILNYRYLNVCPMIQWRYILKGFQIYTHYKFHFIQYLMEVMLSLWEKNLANWLLVLTLYNKRSLVPTARYLPDLSKQIDPPVPSTRLVWFSSVSFLKSQTLTTFSAAEEVAKLKPFSENWICSMAP